MYCNRASNKLRYTVPKICSIYMNKYYLHVGMHRTGTKFFQHKVFPNLPADKFTYNPPKMTQLVGDLIKADEDDSPFVIDAINNERQILQDTTDTTVLISREIMSGDCFSFYQDNERTSRRLSMAFPEAHIICFLRFQVDWILSCYRESLHEHHYQSLDQFLSIHPHGDGFVCNRYQDLNLDEVISGLIDKFGKQQVSFFFFEHLRSDKLALISKLSHVLDTAPVQVTEDFRRLPNRGYSAFAIKLSIVRYNIMKLLGLKTLSIHRPIVFFGDKGIPAGFKHLSVLAEDKYWHDGFLRDNEEVRSKDYPHLSVRERIRMALSWRSIVKRGVDSMLYWDWDLLGTRRAELEAFFREQNIRMFDKHKDLFTEIPEIYTKDA